MGLPPVTARAPGPKGGLIWGSLAGFRGDPLGFLQMAARDHGDVARLRFGPITAHLINHPDLVEQVLSRDAAQYDKKTRSADRIAATCGKSLLSADRNAWRRHRRLIQPVFQPRHLGGIEAVVDGAIAPMIARWREVARAGGTIDVVADMAHLAIGISAKVLFDSDVDAARIEAALAVLLDDTWRRLEAPLDLSMISDAFHRPAFKAARADIDRIVFDIIAARQHSGDAPGNAPSNAPGDLLQLLLHAHEAEGEARLSDTELRDAAVTLLLAGHETTANALAWALHLMGEHPDQGPRIVGADHFFAETIRLYPSIWIVERRAITAREIAGYAIAKGSSVLISPYLLHRHPQFWQAPDAFCPARFVGEHARPRHAYIPFGLGPHRCVGLYMARAIATRVIRVIADNFALSPVKGDAPQVFPGITLRHKTHFRMRAEAI